MVMNTTLPPRCTLGKPFCCRFLPVAGLAFQCCGISALGMLWVSPARSSRCNSVLSSSHPNHRLQNTRSPERRYKLSYVSVQCQLHYIAARSLLLQMRKSNTRALKWTSLLWVTKRKLCSSGMRYHMDAWDTGHLLTHFFNAPCIMLK